MKNFFVILFTLFHIVLTAQSKKPETGNSPCPKPEYKGLTPAEVNAKFGLKLKISNFIMMQ
jgi:hypothetical protein